MEYTMYNTLLQLPLFQGMSKDDLSDIIEKAKFHFQKFESGAHLFHAGAPCFQLTFLIHGELRAEIHAPCSDFSFIEIFTEPMLIEPHSLFGASPIYKATYTAQTSCSILSIDKQYIHSVLNAYEIFRINFFNHLCHKTEQLHEKLWSINEQALEGRIIHFVKGLCSTYQGTKILKIKMEHLARLLDDTRLNVSYVLNKWEKEGIIEMHRKEFIFKDIGRLLPTLQSKITSVPFG